MRTRELDHQYPFPYNGASALKKGNLDNDMNPKEEMTRKGRPKRPTGRLAPLTTIVAVAMLVVAILLIPQPRSSTAWKAVAQPGPGSSKPDSDTLVKDIVTIDEEARDINERLGSLENQSASLQDRISGIETDISMKRQKLARKRSALSLRVRNMYVNGKTSNLELLLTSEDLDNFLERADYLQKVTAQDGRLIKGIKEQSQNLNASLVELKQRKTEVDNLASEFKKRQKRLAQTRSEREKLLTQAGENRQAVQVKSGKVEEKIDQLNPPEPAPGKRTGRSMTMVATGYSAQEPGLDENTATGMKAQHGVVAVDPGVIPLGTRLSVEGYGNAIAGDTGSAIKGNRIDLCFDTLAEVEAYGWRTIKVEILD